MAELLILSTFARIGISHDSARIEKGEEQEGDHDAVPAERRDHVGVTIEEEVYSLCHEGDGPQCGEEDGTTTCEIVFADACLGLVSSVCRGAATKKNGGSSADVSEFRLRPAP